MERACQYNDGVVCDSSECYHCGWDPAVGRERLKALSISKLYKIPFTGYCEVWAESPEEAADKADNDEMFFVHYDFGDPISTAKEDDDELD